MMTEQTVDLNEFRYTDGSQYHHATAVTLKAPSFKDFRVHNAMTGYAKRAQFGAIGLITKDALDNIQRIQAEAAARGDQVPQEADPAENLSNLQLALGEDAYHEFFTKTQKFLTNNSRLAVIAGTDAPLNDEAWDDIAEKNGIRGVERVIGAFVGFFA